MVDDDHQVRVAAPGRRSGLEDTWTRMRQLAGDDVTLGELGSLSDGIRQ